MGKSRKGVGVGVSLAWLLVLALLTFAFYYYERTEGTAQPVAGTQAELTAKPVFTAHFIDVGQGDSILLTCGDESMLIDAGERDKAEDVINYLQSVGITELTYVVATHPHSDHIGGMAKVLDSFPVKDFIAPDVTHTTKTFENLLDAVERNNLDITITEPLDEYTLGDAKLTVLSPAAGKKHENLNDYSVILKAEYEGTSFLFTGDAEKNAENDMLDAGYALKADVLKVGHHGSSTSTGEKFINAVLPKYAVISCGLDNSYNHPHDIIMDRLTKKGTEIYITMESGTIVAKSDGKSIVFETERN